MAQLIALNYVSGDTKPPLIGRIADVDITGYIIKLHIKYPTPLEKTASIDSAEDGEFSFQWAPTDLVTGRWNAEIEVTDADGKVETAQNILFIVKAEIA